MARTKNKKKFKSVGAEPQDETTRTEQGQRVEAAHRNWAIGVSSIWAAVGLALLGLVTYFSGLKGSFLGDDQGQVVNNPYIRSLSHIGTYFSGGTFYNGQTKLVGVYYRPLMTTAYALIYSIAHLNPVGYHVFQLALNIFCAFMLFIIFRYFFEPIVSLVLAALFLVDPVNSQAVYSVASLQEPLFVAFGLVAFWITIKCGVKRLGTVALIATLLLLSLLSKETGILFVAAVVGYAAIANSGKWRELLPLGLACIIILAIYLILRVHAVGLDSNPNLAPIDDLSLAGRLMNAPAIILFYLTKIIFPFSLAHAYYWVHKGLSLRYFAMPLILDLAIVGAAGYIGWKLFKRDTRQFVLFAFFVAWFVAGLALTLQVAPLDETVSETWLYFPLIGLLGALGVLYETYMHKVSPRLVLALTAIVIVAFCVRTSIRGTNWSNGLTLDRHDISVSKEDYSSYDGIAQVLTQQNNFGEALQYSMRSVSIFPTSTNLNTLGAIYMNQGHYAEAEEVYARGLTYSPLEQLYENNAELALVYGNEQTNQHYLSRAITLFPQDGKLWDDIAIWDDSHDDNADAKVAMVKSSKYESAKPAYYDAVMAGELIGFEHSQTSQ